jgi:cell wall-associated NlpC family hydrolase
MRRCLVALFASFALVGVTLPASAEDSIELDPSWYQIEPTPEQSQEKAAEDRAKSAAKANRQMRAAVTKGEKLVTLAAKLRGTPYRFAGSSPRTGFDCSGYTSYVYRQLGIELPRSSGAIRNVAKKVNKADLRKGDLVFWHSKSGRVFHVGIYAGGGKAWHAPRPGRSVTLQSIWLAGGRQTSYVTYGRI